VELIVCAVIVYSKAEEFKNAVQADYLQWVAQYMVMKRASIEPNFHQLYIDFMDALEALPDFGREIVKETFRNIKVCTKIIDQLLTNEGVLHGHYTFQLEQTRILSATFAPEQHITDSHCS
jgi:hypothetical protein